MSASIPEMGSVGDSSAELHNKNVREEVEKNIIKLDFSKKVALIKPLAKALWYREGKDILKDIYKINDVRNEIFHYLNIKEIKFNGKPLSSEDGLEAFVDITHQRFENIEALIEFIDK